MKFYGQVFNIFLGSFSTRIFTIWRHRNVPFHFKSGEICNLNFRLSNFNLPLCKFPRISSKYHLHSKQGCLHLKANWSQRGDPFLPASLSYDCRRGGRSFLCKLELYSSGGIHEKGHIFLYFFIF